MARGVLWMRVERRNCRVVSSLASGRTKQPNQRDNTNCANILSNKQLQIIASILLLRASFLLSLRSFLVPPMVPRGFVVVRIEGRAVQSFIGGVSRAVVLITLLGSSCCRTSSSSSSSLSLSFTIATTTTTTVTNKGRKKKRDIAQGLSPKGRKDVVLTVRRCDPDSGATPAAVVMKSHDISGCRVKLGGKNEKVWITSLFDWMKNLQKMS